MLKHLQSFVDGTAPLSKQANIDTAAHFTAKGYKEIVPYHKEEAPRDLLKAFYEEDHMFTLTTETLK
jgi:hypothetical protein